MALAELDKDNYDDAIASDEKPIMVDFWGPQCVPCLGLMPIVEKLAEEYSDRVAFYKVNTAENRRLAMRLRVIGLPTFLFYQNGEKVGELTGEFGEADIIEKLESLL